MKIRTKQILASAAVAGLISGVSVSAFAKSTGTTNSGSKVTTLADKGGQSCKGHNGCKGQGGCKSGDNGCKGKNSCKGKGGCASKGS